MKFFKYVFASALGTLLAGALLLVILFGLIIGSITAAMDDFAMEKSTRVYENSVLTLHFDQPIVERAPKEDVVIPGFTTKQSGLNQIISSIEKAKDDDRIEGIYLNLSGVGTGFASVEAMRNSLMDFKESGKWIIAYSEYYSQAAYYLASVADEIYLNPEGIIEFTGLNYEPMFMKDLFDKIGVEMQVVRGKDNNFKSAVEPFMYNEMSESNRMQSALFINSIWDHIVNEIAAARGITIENVNAFANELGGMYPDEVLESHFIDGLIYQDELNTILTEKLEVDELDTKQLVSLEKYAKTKGKKSTLADYKKKKVTVIYAVGDITSGEGNDETIGSDRIAKAIREARQDSSVKAVVLRVNSPGGSALASDVIWRETELLAEEKPLVVSMGDYAASGGYYISVAADRIFAEPNTITGSIGVFGVIPNAQDLLNDKIGVHFDGVKTNTHSDIFNFSKPLSESEYAIIQKRIDQTYDSFKDRVASGRNLRVSYVDSIGQGRVWTGEDALEIGLVDEIGGMDDAIAYAASLAEVDDYRIQELPYQKSSFEQMMEDFGVETSQKLLESKLEDFELLRQYNYIQSIMNLRGIQAILPIRVSF
jgi:protease-4